jgi:hypothetical protein
MYELLVMQTSHPRKSSPAIRAQVDPKAIKLHTQLTISSSISKSLQAPYAGGFAEMTPEERGSCECQAAELAAWEEKAPEGSER